MLATFSGTFLNMIKANRKTYWTTMASNSGAVYPVATVSFAIFVEGSMNTVFLQFRGEQAIQRLKTHFETGINGLNVEGHIENFKLPTVEEANSNTYSNMLECVDDNSVIGFNGVLTTIIVIDSFSSCAALTVADVNDICIRKGITPDTHPSNGLRFNGIISTNTSITNDGPKYTFGKSTNKDKSKVRYSVSGLARHGSSYGKIRVEIHGANRVDLFSSVVSNNNSLFVNGTVIIYRESDGSVSFAVWVNQFFGFNSGNVESVGGIIGSLGEVDLLESVLTEEPEWSAIYGESSSEGESLNADMFTSDDDIPF